MKLHLQEFKNLGPAPIISYKLDPTVGIKTETKYDFLKVNIKNQPGESSSNMILLYTMLFRTGSMESLLRILNLIHNITKRKSLTSGSKIYETKNKLQTGEALRIF